ncbi:hypothetical protein CEXT_677521 [Caerostris extrusa]|uniref:Uncharacterized protein n=1 Tax=Caerostris extrusa TaxID=172846 RepID=A0AAV4N1Q6_CAEEX|nr:hypothetical protein CEXT_677521 [Caerostris extrusa]
MVVGSMPFEISKGVKSSISQGSKERFLRRISKGLTEENWENMGNLSYECSNLLENLLQPDQFKRLTIEATKHHPWFLNDEALRKRLPQHRMDLRLKFEPEIIEVMADKLHQTKQRIQIHLASGEKYDRVSAMFFILQDTLVKEVLYPPRDLENSFIYQLECRRKARSSKEVEEQDEIEEVSQNSQNSEHISRGFIASGSAYSSHSYSTETINRPLTYEAVRNGGKLINITDIRKRIGDGNNNAPEKNSLVGNSVRKNSWAPRTEEKFSKLKSVPPDKFVNQYETEAYPVAGQPYRSYKYNRPTRNSKKPLVQKLGTDKSKIQKDLENRPEENDYLEILDNTSTFSAYSGSSNYRNDIKILNEDFYKNCCVSPQNNYNVSEASLKGQQRGMTPLLNQTYPRNTVPGRRGFDVNQYASDQILQLQQKQPMRPNTTESLMKSKNTNTTENKSCQKCIVDPSILSHYPKQIQQSRQRSMIIRRSNALNKAYSTNQNPMNRTQYRTPTTLVQRPPFSVPTRKSNVENKKAFNLIPKNLQLPAMKSKSSETNRTF